MTLPTVESEWSICVAGVGARTAIGASAPASAAAARCGIPGFSEHPCLMTAEGDPMIVAAAPDLDPFQGGAERFLSLALPAAAEAIAPLMRRRLPSQLPCILGLPSDRPGRPPDLEAQVTRSLRDTTGIANIELVARGHSAGTIALEAGCRKICSGQAEACLVGGLDSYLEAETLHWIEQNGQLHGGSNAWGFVPGEGAGFCLLCSSVLVRQLGLPVMAEVLAAATTHEPNLIKSHAICVGQGLTEAFRQALAALSGAKIDHVICDMNGEPYRADEYGFTVARMSSAFVDAANFQAPADCWGDVGAASGPLFVALHAGAVLRHYVPGRFTLIWTSSESGERCAAVLQTPQGAGDQ